MEPAQRFTAPGTAIEILAEREALDFFDSQSIDLHHPLSALEAWNRIMAKPLPGMALALSIRDFVSSRFGVKKIGHFSGRHFEKVKIGDKLDFFLVERISHHQLVLTERDRHLDVMTTISTDNDKLTITSSVVTHNAFGKLYMLPVGPAHKLIVLLMLKRFEPDLPERL